MHNENNVKLLWHCGVCLSARRSRADKHTPCKIKNSMKSKMISLAKAGVKLKT